jgi:hypothetical protein
MSSDKRIRASRANGALSRGAKTAAGKLKSSQNALRHGLLANLVVMNDEPREAFEALFHSYFDRFGPLDAVEAGMVEEMVAAWWRLRRTWAIENHLLDTAALNHHGPDPIDRLAGAFTGLAATPDMNLLHRYETRLHMMFQRAFQNLLVLRREAPPGIPNEPRVRSYSAEHQWVQVPPQEDIGMPE